MRPFLTGLMLCALALGMSSCFLVSIPVKATGEIIEKGAEATGRATASGIRRATTPGQPQRSYVEDSFSEGENYDSYGYPE